MSTPRILIIAGSDSGGGAGIQADIKTVTMLGGHAMTAITAITAQNTLGVQAVMPVPAEMVLAQIDSVVSDIGVDAVKIGMIGSAETAHAVAERLEKLAMPIVFDPVMVATSGSVLADAPTIAAFERLMRIASVVTPNISELEALGGEEAVLAHGCHLLAKGGHAEGDFVIDRLLGPNGEVRRLEGKRFDTDETHGTGCTLASALATGLGKGVGIEAAFEQAVSFVRIAILEAPGLGKGNGPLGQQAVRLDVGKGPRLNQFSLKATDLAAARDFYRRLGLKLIVDSAANNYHRFEAPGGATLSLWEEGTGVYFEYDDLDAEVTRLQSLGFVFDQLPEDRPWGWRVAWLHDPEGNRICLYSAGEYRRFPPWRISTAK